LGFYDAGVHVTADILFGALRVAVSEVRFTYVLSEASDELTETM